MRFTLTINLDNAAFHGEPDELARLVHQVAETAAAFDVTRLAGPFGVYDVNGNRVGSWEFTEEG